MKNTFSFITPFPDVINSYISSSIMNKANEKGIVDYNILNLFEYGNSPHYKIDDYPFGGGDGMVLKPEPIFRAIDKLKVAINSDNMRVVFPTPDGPLFSQDLAKELVEEQNIVFICGHYKGIDQRVRDNLVTDEISIGDFVITGGELPSLIIADSIVRLIPDVIGEFKSARTDSFYDSLLDGPHYTRPEEFRGMNVPDVLLSGNHKKIKDWFQKNREDKTKERRKDLWKNYLTKLEDGV
tara:strand:+ start:447 stop:1163 length:717 start_codon:yes stop_codon:yes gene_type:complete